MLQVLVSDSPALLWSIEAVPETVPTEKDLLQKAYNSEPGLSLCQKSFISPAFCRSLALLHAWKDLAERTLSRFASCFVGGP